MNAARSLPPNIHLPPHLREACQILAHGLLRLHSRAADKAARDAADRGESSLHFPAPHRRAQVYAYYVSQSALKGGAAAGPPIARVPAGDIEAAVMAQVRALLRQPEVVVDTWRGARAEASEVSEDEVRAALEQLEPLWDELFPAEQARIVRLLVDRVEVGVDGADIRLWLDGLASLVRDLAARPADMARSA